MVPIGITPTGRWVLAADDPARWALTGGALPRGRGRRRRRRGRCRRGRATGTCWCSRPARCRASSAEVDVVLPAAARAVRRGRHPAGAARAVRRPLRRRRRAGVGGRAWTSTHEGRPGRRTVCRSARTWWCCRATGSATRDRVARRRRGARLPGVRQAGPRRVEHRASRKVHRPRGPRRRDRGGRASTTPRCVVEAAIVGREIECGVLEDPDGGPPLTCQPGEIEVVAGRATSSTTSRPSTSTRPACG